MKKTASCVLLFVCLLFMCGCNKNKADTGLNIASLLPEGTVTEVRIKEFLSTTEYIYSGGIQFFVDGIKSLPLITKYREKEEPPGFSTYITFVYEDGSAVTITYFSITDFNSYIKTADGPWYKLSEVETYHLDSLLAELDKRSAD